MGHGAFVELIYKKGRCKTGLFCLQMDTLLSMWWNAA